MSAQDELDAAILAHRAAPTGANKAAVLAAQRRVRDEFFATERAEMMARVGAR